MSINIQQLKQATSDIVADWKTSAEYDEHWKPDSVGEARAVETAMESLLRHFDEVDDTSREPFPSFDAMIEYLKTLNQERNDYAFENAQLSAQITDLEDENNDLRYRLQRVMDYAILENEREDL